MSATGDYHSVLNEAINLEVETEAPEDVGTEDLHDSYETLVYDCLAYISRLKDEIEELKNASNN